MKHVKLRPLLGAIAMMAAFNSTLAQTPPNLALQLYAGLNISGTTGSVYAIQSVPDLALSNSWTTLAFLQLPATNFLWVDATAPATGRRFYRAILENPPTNMVFIRPNTFNLGSPTNEAGRLTNEGPQTSVTLTHGYWICRFEVTQAEYLAVMGQNPSANTGDLRRPVDSVSWLDATNYCATLTARELAAGRIPPGSQYRLPTEAEWEYAARAGTSTRFSYGDDPGLTDLPSHAWFGGNSGITSHPVGQKLPNAWGLYDMEGNVLEWCLDWFSPYPGGFELDPQGPPVPFDFLSTYKVTRGGAFDTTDMECRSAQRGIFGVGQSLTDYDLGFRVVLAVAQP